MLVKYQTDRTGNLKIQDSSGRTLILSDRAWEIRRIGGKHVSYIHDIDPRSTEAFLPDTAFEGMYYGIRRFHKKSLKQGLYLDEETNSFAKHLESIEDTIVDLLRLQGADMKDYLWGKEITRD